jgi:hypothetical protein
MLGWGPGWERELYFDEDAKLITCTGGSNVKKIAGKASDEREDDEEGARRTYTCARSSDYNTRLPSFVRDAWVGYLSGEGPSDTGESQSDDGLLQR